MRLVRVPGVPEPRSLPAEDEYLTGVLRIEGRDKTPTFFEELSRRRVLSIEALIPEDDLSGIRLTPECEGFREIIA